MDFRSQGYERGLVKVYLAGYLKVIGYEGNFRAELTQVQTNQEKVFNFDYDLSKQPFNNAGTVYWHIQGSAITNIEDLNPKVGLRRVAFSFIQFRSNSFRL